MHLDQMQNRGFVPSVIEETILKGPRYIGKHQNTIVYYDTANNITLEEPIPEGKIVGKNQY